MLVSLVIFLLLDIMDIFYFGVVCVHMHVLQVVIWELLSCHVGASHHVSTGALREGGSRSRSGTTDPMEQGGPDLPHPDQSNQSI